MLFQSQIGPFRALRFIPFEATFDSGAENADNTCYCPFPEEKGCLPSGLHDISSCQPGSPIIISWPHFLYGDPSLKAGVEGMSPDKEKHTFFLDIEPVWKRIHNCVMDRLLARVHRFRNTE